MTQIKTDKETIQRIAFRGVEKNFPSDDFLIKKLSSGEKLRIYMGIDPTGPTLHMGHMVTIKKLSQFQKAGHEVILLIGNFTATIGDPDKKDVRKQLTAEEVMENAKLYQKQASLYLDFEGENPAFLKYNKDWLGEMKFEDVLNLASKMTVQQMLQRDMFKRRLDEEKPIYIHEFMYPLMQGYDSVAMDVDGEVGGNDQTFNMLAGRTMLKEIKDKEKFVVPMKLLVDPNGNKMGKTTGNMLSLLDSPFEMFSKIMSWTDGMIMSGFELLTDQNLEEIQKRLDEGENPKNLKTELGKNIVTFCFSKEKADEAEKNWTLQFSKKEIPDNLEEVEVQKETGILDILVNLEMVNSKKEARRKIDEGAVYINEQKVDSWDFTPQEDSILKLGKKMKKIILK
ncbi:tyrosine--tRNA ligase [Candidatus Campbellbacteria bacterium]|nr:MAG: tyrosine--tRNA ligase [Candidatus Campbellbacteria bacterium]